MPNSAFKIQHSKFILVVLMSLALILHTETFSWTEFRIYPDFFVGWVIFGVAYYLCIGPLRRYFPGSSRVPLAKVASFTAGLLLMLGALQGPLHELSDYFL